MSGGSGKCPSSFHALTPIAASPDRIVRLLGQGTFGKVVEAREQATNRKVAIKIIRAVQKYRDASAIEIRVLQALRKGDPTNI